MRGKRVKMVYTGVRLPKEVVEASDLLVKSGLYVDKSSLLREAVSCFVNERIILLRMGIKSDDEVKQLLGVLLKSIASSVKIG